MKQGGTGRGYGLLEGGVGALPGRSAESARDRMMDSIPDPAEGMGRRNWQGEGAKCARKVTYRNYIGVLDHRVDERD
jgi:hypothetical protein